LQIFISFFDNLQQFYTNQTYASLKTILEEFFFALFRTMFAILNPLEKVTKKDFECLRRSMSSLEPFADIPTKMSIQLERSVGTARSLTQALRSTSQILQSVLQVYSCFLVLYYSYRVAVLSSLSCFVLAIERNFFIIEG
uniref:ABC transmembrane type-1 domain-containing protein n=1 Tax=Ascaris lumbricoides TaxID=6252 RepID=A0A0M3HI40_ASCLU